MSSSFRRRGVHRVLVQWLYGVQLVQLNLHELVWRAFVEWTFWPPEFCSALPQTTATVNERPCSLPLVLVDCNAAQQADSD